MADLKHATGQVPDQIKRLVVLADLHGFWESLGVLAALPEVAAPDTQVLVAGDLVPGGAEPLRVLDWVAQHAGRFSIIGNHDEKTLSRPGEPLHPFSEASVARQMTPGHWEFLSNLPHVLDLSWRGYRLRLLHGHRTVTGQPVGWSVSARTQSAAFHDPAFDAVFAGHTHFPYAVRLGRSWMANPGSTGNNILRIRQRDGTWQPRSETDWPEHAPEAPTYSSYLVVTEAAGALHLELRRFDWPRAAIQAAWEATAMANVTRRLHWARTGTYDHLLP